MTPHDGGGRPAPHARIDDTTPRNHEPPNVIASNTSSSPRLDLIVRGGALPTRLSGLGSLYDKAAAGYILLVGGIRARNQRGPSGYRPVFTSWAVYSPVGKRAHWLPRPHLTPNLSPHFANLTPNFANGASDRKS